MIKSYIKIKVDQSKLEEIRDFYECKEIKDAKNPYLLFQTKTEDGVEVTAYKSKDHFTIVFSGRKDDIINEASIFEEEDIVLQSIVEYDEEKKTNSNSIGYKDVHAQIGSDEVGVGDLFGPLVICAAYIRPSDMNILERLKVRDSKKLNDNNILSIGKELSSLITSSLIICSPKKICSLKEEGWSMHKIMANLHNQCHLNLLKNKEIPNNTIIYIDQFESSELYFKYLVTESPKNTHPFHFETKGESYYPSIAVASVLARYHFLLAWEKMENELGCIIPKGASSEADKVLLNLIKKLGNDAVVPHVKTFFRNYKDLNFTNK